MDPGDQAHSAGNDTSDPYLRSVPARERDFYLALAPSEQGGGQAGPDPGAVHSSTGADRDPQDDATPGHGPERTVQPTQASNFRAGAAPFCCACQQSTAYRHRHRGRPRRPVRRARAGNQGKALDPWGPSCPRAECAGLPTLVLGVSDPRVPARRRRQRPVPKGARRPRHVGEPLREAAAPAPEAVHQRTRRRSERVDRRTVVRDVPRPQ